MNKHWYLGLLTAMLALGTTAGEDRLEIGQLDRSKLKQGRGGLIYPVRVLRKPEGIPHVSSKDFRIDPKRAAKMKDTLYGSAEGMRDLADFFQNDSEGRKLWQSQTKLTVKVVNEWKMPTKRSMPRHIGCLQKMGQYGMVYAYSGNPALRRCIHDYLLDALSLPMEFWIHAEIWGKTALRKGQPPLAGLHTGYVAIEISQMLSVCDAEIFTPEELKEVKKQLREKVSDPLYNYLVFHKDKNSNWIGNIATGLLYISSYLGETDRHDLALDRLTSFIRKGIQKDGSYGEGVHYFCYMMSEATKAWAIFSPADRKKFCADNPLEKSFRWLTTGLYLNRNADGSFKPEGVVFSDSTYLFKPSAFMQCWWMVNYRDPLAAWIWKNKLSPASRKVKSVDGRLRFQSLGKIPEIQAKSPEEMKLPLVNSYDNGESHLRASWKPGSTVIGLKRSAMINVSNWHTRPESNNLVMSSLNDYLVVGPGVSCYDGKLWKEYDSRTISANTVMVDGQDQLKIKPKSHVTDCRNGETEEYLWISQDSAPVYKGMKQARRTVVLFKKSGNFAVIDQFTAKSGTHQYDLRWHFYNWDYKSKLTGANGKFTLTRPNTKLEVQISATTPLAFSEEKAIMHQCHNTYLPGAEGEGDWGNALGLKAAAKPAREITFVSLFQPHLPGKTPAPISCSGTRITCDRVTVDVSRLGK